jgi:hypothetical protein
MFCDEKSGGKVAVRLNQDMGMAPICDTCVANSRAADVETNERFVPKFEEPNEVVPGVLYIGSKASQVDLNKLKDYGITRVLICCRSLKAYHNSDSGI